MNYIHTIANTNLGAVHEVAEIFYCYLLEHIQVSDQDLRHLPNVEPVALHKRSTSNTHYHHGPSQA